MGKSSVQSYYPQKCFLPTIKTAIYIVKQSTWAFLVPKIVTGTSQGICKCLLKKKKIRAHVCIELPSLQRSSETLLTETLEEAAHKLYSFIWSVDTRFLHCSLLTLTWAVWLPCFSFPGYNLTLACAVCVLDS